MIPRFNVSAKFRSKGDDESAEAATNDGKLPSGLEPIGSATGVSAKFRSKGDESPQAATNGGKLSPRPAFTGSATNKPTDTAKSENIPKPLNEGDHLGFAHLPEQMHRKAVKKGFHFTLMVVGESGLGKSTLIRSLLTQDIYSDRKVTNASERISCKTKVTTNEIELDECGVKLHLTVLDTAGFNDAVDATNCWQPIKDYINEQYEKFFIDECGLNRKNIQDKRVHCCLYFISPYGHGLRQVDVETMHQLQNIVNIVPVIAKADTFTATELLAFKKRINADIERYNIEIYRLPECDSDEDDDIKKLDKEIKAVLPFAVIGSNCSVETEGKRKVRGRKYPWGVVELDNSRHCDFTHLRTCLLKTHMQDLKDVTLDIHYENYRVRYIKERMEKRTTNRRDFISAVLPDREAFDAIAENGNISEQTVEEAQLRIPPTTKRGSQQLSSDRSSDNPSISSATILDNA